MNSHGEVVGVRYGDDSSCAPGICFAIGINTAKFVASRLLQKVVSVGVSLVSPHKRCRYCDESYDFYDLPRETGAVVMSVEKIVRLEAPGCVKRRDPFVRGTAHGRRRRPASRTE